MQFPYVTAAIVTACAVIFGATNFYLQNQDTYYNPDYLDDHPELRGEMLIALRIIGLVGKFGRYELSDVWAGHPLQYLASIFAHGSVMHVAFNMMALWFIGAVMELSLGRIAYIGLIAASAFVSSGDQVAFDSAPGIGFSGVIYALFGFMWATKHVFQRFEDIANSQMIKQMLAWALLCIVATFFRAAQIGNAAHVGGLLFGLALGNVLYGRKLKALWGAGLALTIGAAICSCVWMPWSAPWNFYAGVRALDHNQFAVAASRFELSAKGAGDDKNLLSESQAMLRASIEPLEQQCLNKGDFSCANRYRDQLEKLPPLEKDKDDKVR